MPINITKQLLITADVAWGLGKVTQPRDSDADGVTEQIEYDEVNASFVPATDNVGALSDVQTELDARYTKTESDTIFARNDNVLNLDELDPYTPTLQYHPATKLYVDQKVVDVGAGDMAKVVYDTNDNGVVDNADAIGGVGEGDIFMLRGLMTDADIITKMGVYYGSVVINAPTSNDVQLRMYVANGILTQDCIDVPTGVAYTRMFNATWTEWATITNSTLIINDLLGSANPATALGGNQGKILNETKVAIAGDTMTGQLGMPGGGTGVEVLQSDEIITLVDSKIANLNIKLSDDGKVVVKSDGSKISTGVTAACRFDGKATPPTISDSYNVTGVVRNSTGHYTVTFQDTMDNINFTAVGNSDFSECHVSIDGQTADTMNVLNVWHTGTLTNDVIDIIVFGGVN